MLVHKKFSDTLKTHKKFSVRTQNFLWNRQFLMLKNFYVWTQKFLWNQSHICLVRAVGQHDTIWCRCLSGVLVSTLVSGSQQLNVQQFESPLLQNIFFTKKCRFHKNFCAQTQNFLSCNFLVARTSITNHKNFCAQTQNFLSCNPGGQNQYYNSQKILCSNPKVFETAKRADRNSITNHKNFCAQTQNFLGVAHKIFRA